eukprot:tig00000144_g9039.t1
MADPGPVSPPASRFRNRLAQALASGEDGEKKAGAPSNPAGEDGGAQNGDAKPEEGRFFSMPQLKNLFAKFRALGDGQEITRRVWEARTWNIFGMQRGKYFQAADYDKTEHISFGKYVRLMALLVDKGVLRAEDTGPPEEGAGMSWRQVSAAERMFRKLDNDGNQVISCEELLDELKKVNRDATTRGATRLLAVLDSDSSGEISFDEFLEGVALGLIALDPALLPAPPPAPAPPPPRPGPRPAHPTSPPRPVPSPVPSPAPQPSTPTAHGGAGRRTGRPPRAVGLRRHARPRAAPPTRPASSAASRSPPPASSPHLLRAGGPLAAGGAPAGVAAGGGGDADAALDVAAAAPRAGDAHAEPAARLGAPPSPRGIYPPGLSRSDGVFRAAARAPSPRAARRGPAAAPRGAPPARRGGAGRGGRGGEAGPLPPLPPPRRRRRRRPRRGDLAPLAPFSRLAAPALFAALDREAAGRLTVDVFLEAAPHAPLDLPAALAALAPAPRPAAPASSPGAPAAGGAPSHELKVKAYKAFAAFDVDGSGTISLDELARLLRAIDPRVTAPEVHRIFLQVDVDRSGLITFDEFLAAAHASTLDLARLDVARLPARPPSPAAARPRPPPAAEWEIAYEELRLGRRLGEGSFGVVFEADWRGTRVAVKMLKGGAGGAPGDGPAEELRREIAVLCGQRHPNIALFMGACTRRPHLCLVTEFLDGGSVWDLVHGPRAARRDGRPAGLEPSHAAHIALQVARGLNYLHLSRTPIIHHDLKPDNLLLDRNMNVKLCDFGLATVRSSASSPAGAPREAAHDSDSYTGTLNYMAPEQLASPLPSSDVRTDIFALGSCIFEMLTGQIPFRGASYRTVRRLVCDEGVRPTFPPLAGPRAFPVPPQLVRNPAPAPAPPPPRRPPTGAQVALVERCWAPRPEQRPSAAEVLRILENYAAQAPHSPEAPPRRHSRGGSRDSLPE